MVIHEVLPVAVVLQNSMPPVHGALQQQNQQQPGQAAGQQAGQQQPNWWQQQLQQHQHQQQQAAAPPPQMPPKYDLSQHRHFHGCIKDWMKQIGSSGFDTRDGNKILELFKHDKELSINQVQIFGSRIFHIHVQSAMLHIEEVGTNQAPMSFVYRNARQPGRVAVMGVWDNIFIGYSYYHTRPVAEMLVFNGDTGEVHNIGQWPLRRQLNMQSAGRHSELPGFACTFSGDGEYCLVKGSCQGPNPILCRLVQMKTCSFVETIQLDKSQYGVPVRAVFDQRPHRLHVLSFIVASSDFSHLTTSGTLLQYDVIDRQITRQYTAFQFSSDLLDHTKDGDLLLVLTRKRNEMWIFKSDDLTPLFTLPHQNYKTKLHQLFPLMSKCGSKIAFVEKDNYRPDTRKKAKVPTGDPIPSTNDVIDKIMADVRYNVAVYKLPERLMSLQEQCRKYILQHTQLERVTELPLPPRLLTYLQWQ